MSQTAVLALLTAVIGTIGYHLVSTGVLCLGVSRRDKRNQQNGAVG